MLTLDHVQIAIPADGEAEAQRFWGDVLGLTEIDKPAALQGRGGCWFQLGERQLHLGVDPHFRPAKKAHIALATSALNQVWDGLDAAGFPVHPDAPLDGRERFYSEDPFGNRVEFIELSS